MATAAPHRAAPVTNRSQLAAIGPEQLAADFKQVRTATEALAQGLSAEDQNLQSAPFASPAKWHRAHTTWFFETFVLKPHSPSWEPCSPAWNYLFNSYYNGVGRQYPRPQRGLISRPDIHEVAAWRRRVDRAVLALIDNPPAGEFTRLAELVRLGLNHEQQHQELLVTDIKHGFSKNPLHPAWHQPRQPARHDGAPLRWIKFDGHTAGIGMPDDGRFCYDNEQPRHRQIIEPFELAARPVTCGEFLEFMRDGGYEDPSLWLSDGWRWLKENDIQSPLYWQHTDEGWKIHTPGGLQALDPAEALAHVSFYEAAAFAHWAGARLPTEAEWEIAATSRAGSPGPTAESGRLHPAASRPDQSGKNLLADMLGNVWEWTASSYLPYPGYKAPAGAIGEYNGKFMANQMVLRGGSCATPLGHIRPTYRNFFYPPDRWQFTGLRLARH
ncbi:MAG TPA: ergothioneine biosynthesis protein EgtB [Wenzhouxiangella sp.]|nr:ergothioneine biosynthesis protein EgtB [Wenzhouxiangella sp.]